MKNRPTKQEVVETVYRYRFLDENDEESIEMYKNSVHYDEQGALYIILGNTEPKIDDNTNYDDILDILDTIIKW